MGRDTMQSDFSWRYHIWEIVQKWECGKWFCFGVETSSITFKTLSILFFDGNMTFETSELMHECID